MPLTKIAIGFFIGLLCGVIPLIYGLLTKCRALAFGGLLASVVAGILFNVLEKSPFSAIVVAILFVIIIVVRNKRHAKHDDSDELLDDEFDDEP